MPTEWTLYLRIFSRDTHKVVQTKVIFEGEVAQNKLFCLYEITTFNERR